MEMGNWGGGVLLLPETNLTKEPLRDIFGPTYLLCCSDVIFANVFDMTRPLGLKMETG